MRLTHLGHACLLVETAGARMLIDPGAFSDGWHGLDDLAAVVVTHQHPDHLDREHVPGLMAANPQARLLAEPQAAEIARGLGLSCADLDGTTDVAGARLEAVGRQHALIHDDLPRIGNRGVRISAEGEPTVFHPGDALDGEPGEVDVLAFPLNAPWQRSREMTAFLRRIAAPVAVPVHDGLLNETGRALYLGQARDLGHPETDVRDLRDAGPVSFTR